MATEKQIAANKRNACRSTGPRTQQGKARSRMNALRHGLASTLPAYGTTWDDVDKHPFSELDARIRRIDRERIKAAEIIADLIESTARDKVENRLRRLNSLERYATRAYRRLLKRLKSPD